MQEQITLILLSIITLAFVVLVVWLVSQIRSLKAELHQQLNQQSQIQKCAGRAGQYAGNPD